MQMPFEQPESESLLAAAKAEYRKKILGRQTADTSELAETIWTLKAEVEKAEPHEKNKRKEELEHAQEQLISAVTDAYLADAVLADIEDAISRLSVSERVKFYEQAPDGVTSVAQGDSSRHLEETWLVLPKVKNIPSFDDQMYVEMAKILLRKDLLSLVSKKGVDTTLQDSAKPSDTKQAEDRLRDYLIFLDAVMGPRVSARTPFHTPGQDMLSVVATHTYYREGSEGARSVRRYQTSTDISGLLQMALEKDPELFIRLSVLTSMRQRLGGEDTGRRYGTRVSVRSELERAAGGVSTGDRIPYRNEQELEAIRAKLESLVSDLPY